MLSKQFLATFAGIGLVAAQEVYPVNPDPEYPVVGAFQITDFSVSRARYSLTTFYSLELSDLHPTQIEAAIDTTCRYSANTQPASK